MRNRLMIVAVFICCLNCLAHSQDLQIQVPSQQAAIVGQEYSLPVAATGGIMPYTWQVVEGDLPPGLRLQPHKGAIVGTPTTAGTYHFTVAVQDSSIPKLQLRREFSIQVIEGLAVNWKETPVAHGAKISGSAVVTNKTGKDLDLTVVIVAVNEINRATTLGYQHFTLPAGASSDAIPFGSNPGLGTYYVRLDAAAHQPGKKHIFRASVQTSDPIKLTHL